MSESKEPKPEPTVRCGDHGLDYSPMWGCPGCRKDHAPTHHAAWQNEKKLRTSLETLLYETAQERDALRYMLGIRDGLRKMNEAEKSLWADIGTALNQRHRALEALTLLVRAEMNDDMRQRVKWLLQEIDKP